MPEDSPYYGSAQWRTEEPGRLPPGLRDMGFGEAPRAARHDPPRWGWWLWGVGAVTVLLVLATLVSPRVRHEWALSLGRQPTPSTQLGFSDAAALPATAVRGKAIPISFAITNDEGKEMSYQYVVASGSGTTLSSLKAASKTVAAGASWDVNLTVVPKCAATSCHIQVTLPRQNESIDFRFTYQSQNVKKSK